MIAVLRQTKCFKGKRREELEMENIRLSLHVSNSFEFLFYRRKWSIFGQFLYIFHFSFCVIFREPFLYNFVSGIRKKKMSPNYNNFPILLIFRCNNTLNINDRIIVALLNEMEASESK